MANDDRFNKGKESLAKVDSEAMKNLQASLGDVAPDVVKYIVEFVFGDIYTRSGLDLKQRETVIMTAVLAQSELGELEAHVKEALNVGLKQSEIIEIFIQSIPYVGFPKVMDAIAVAKKVFQA